MDKEKLEITQKTAKQIKEYRTLRGLSQESLALSAGLNPAFLGHIERSLKCPTIDTLNKIASALNISLSELFDFDTEKDKDENSKKDKSIQKIHRLTQNLSEREVEKIAEIVSDIINFKNDC